MYTFFKKNYGLVDGNSDKYGLLKVHMFEKGGYDIKDNGGIYNILIEVVEVYNDVIFTKVKIIKIVVNRSKFSESEFIRIFNPWISRSSIHWLTPQTDVSRDNKISKILK